MNKKPLSVANCLLDQLHRLGVEHIFGLPGDYVLGLDKIIENHPSIKFINTTRENTAGYCADAYARIKGLGVACITYGVGINIANAITQAYVENSPVVLISGAAGVQEFAQNPLLHHLVSKAGAIHSDTTQLEIFKQITVAQTVLDNPATAAAEIERVLQACLTHKKPVYIECPRDMIHCEVSNTSYMPLLSKENPEALAEALKETAEILLNSKRPLIWAGHLIQRFGLAKPLLQFAEKYQIPIASTLLGKTVIDEHHPLSIGVYQGGLSQEKIKNFVEKSDCALILGVVLNDVDTGIFTAQIGQKQKIIANPSDLLINHHTFQNVSLANFINGLSTLKNKPKKISADYKKKPPLSFKAKTGKKITTERLFECIQKHLTKNQIVVTDMGDCLLGCVDLIFEQNTFICNAYFASIGFGTPAAIGAQFAAPRKRIIGIVGDGAFQMTSMELSTAVRYGLDPIIILLNNHGYSTERPLLEGKFNDIVDWNYTEIPRVLGSGIGIKANTEEELDNALSMALSQRGTLCIIEVDLDKTDFSPALRRLGQLVQSRIQKKQASL